MISSLVAQLDNLWIYQLPICDDYLSQHQENRKRQSAVIPHICHERHEYIRVNFFWLV